MIKFLQIEQWCEHCYPSFVQIGTDSGTQTLNAADPRTRIVLQEQSREQQLFSKRKGAANGNGALHKEVKQMTSTTELMVYVLGAFGAIVAFSWVIVWMVLKYTEA